MVARWMQVFRLLKMPQKVSHFLPSFRSPMGLSVAIRSLQSAEPEEKHEERVCRKTSKKRGTPVKISLLTFPSTGAFEISETGRRRKYLDQEESNPRGIVLESNGAKSVRPSYKSRVDGMKFTQPFFISIFLHLHIRYTIWLLKFL